MATKITNIADLHALAQRKLPSVIYSYVAGGEWRGKAGAYNLSERIQAGWPIECKGDPTTVMGLPMRKLSRLLK